MNPDLSQGGHSSANLHETVSDEHLASDPPNLAQVKEEDATHHIDKEELEVMDTPLTVAMKVSQCKSSTRRKEKRRHRMLKFQRKLVDVRGLPPSRLMQTPGLSSDLGEARRRNLATDFAKEDLAKMQHGLMLGEAFMHPPGSPSPATTTPSVPMPGFGQGIGITRGSDRFSSLCSSPQSYVGNIGGTMSAGWSEARPMYGYGCDQSPEWDGTML